MNQLEQWAKNGVIDMRLPDTALEEVEMAGDKQRAETFGLQFNPMKTDTQIQFRAAFARRRCTSSCLCSCRALPRTRNRYRPNSCRESRQQHDWRIRRHNRSTDQQLLHFFGIKFPGWHRVVWRKIVCREYWQQHHWRI